jgi:hypothetical protein
MKRRKGKVLLAAVGGIVSTGVVACSSDIEPGPDAGITLADAGISDPGDRGVRLVDTGIVILDAEAPDAEAADSEPIVVDAGILIDTGAGDTE